MSLTSCSSIYIAPAPPVLCQLAADEGFRPKRSVLAVSAMSMLRQGLFEHHVNLHLIHKSRLASFADHVPEKGPGLATFSGILRSEIMRRNSGYINKQFSVITLNR